jgi:hypothetical protein
MRTTVDLDEDVLVRLKDEAQLRSEPFRRTLNEVIRDGLRVAGERRNQKESATRFQIQPYAIGLKPEYSYDSISKLLALAEGEDAR